MVADPKKILGILLLVGSVVTGLVLIEQSNNSLEVQLSAKSKRLAPVLPLNYSISRPTFWESGVRDPDLEARRPGDESDALALIHEIKQYRSDYARGNTTRKTEIAIELYQSYIAMSYYLEDVVFGLIPHNENVKKAATNLTLMRKQAAVFASQVAKNSKNKVTQSVALFHYNVTKIKLGEGRSRASGNLKKLAKKPINGYLKRRAKFIAAIVDLEYSSRSSSAASDLASVVNTMPAATTIAGHLVLAKYHAGLTGSGSKKAKTNKSYRNHLWTATRKASILNGNHREELLRNATAVWRKAEPNTWRKPPIALNSFGSSTTVAAIIERSALEDWSKGNPKKAYRTYKALAKDQIGKPGKAKIDRRIVDIAQADYLKTKKASHLEAVLVAIQKEYMDPAILGDGNEQLAAQTSAYAQAAHRRLVFAQLAAARKNKRVRSSAINMAERYFGFSSDQNDMEAIKAQIAGIYALDGQHKIAVDLYKELIATGNDKNVKGYILSAIASQSTLANWTAQPPWSGAQGGDTGSREELVSLYEALAEKSAANDWFVASHVGLLNISLGRQDVAFTKWQETLKVSSKTKEARYASGMMLTTWHSAKDWDNLESFARFCLTKKISPNWRGKSLRASEFLALALLDGGKDNIANGDNAKAVKRLKEFVSSFKKHKRHDDGFFHLAIAYRGNGQHKDSIKTLLSFVETYPRSGFYKQALLNGGDWALAMAYEDNTSFFYKKYVVEFPKDARVVEIRDELVDLYMGRMSYAEAIWALEQKSLDKRVDQTERLFAGRQVLAIESRFGNHARALRKADNLIADNNTPDVIKAEAYALKANEFGKKGQLTGVYSVIRAMEKLSQSTFEEQDALAEAIFIAAKMESTKALKPYYNLALKDPMKSMQSRYSAYNKARNTFHKVCEVGQTSFCAPSMHELARLSENFLSHLEDISVQETLADDVVKKFNSSKQGILNNAVTEAQRADSKAVATVAEGTSQPNWTQVIFWQNSSDWDFERISNETGNGYVQWTSYSSDAE